MCGILSIYNHNSKIDLKEFQDSLKKLKNRGPDFEGIWNNQKENLYLGHTRLAIIDLSSLSNQPYKSQNEDIILVYNGEIYNYQELRFELIKKGYVFKSKGDVEVLLHSYEEWGFECVNKFNGMFAFVIWDERKKIFFSARDYAGIKPLFYWYEPNKIISFSSQTSCFLTFSEFHKEINFDALSYYLQYRCIKSDQSIYKNCFSVEPGHYIIYDINKKLLSNINYNKPENNFKINREIDYNEKNIYETTESLISNSLKLQIKSDVPLGVFQSGGIDSTIISTILSINGLKVDTYTIGFLEQFDEAQNGKRISEYLNHKNHVYYINSNDLKKAVGLLKYAYDEPFADSSAIPTIYMCKLARENLKVVLSGDGGDELFGGYWNLYKTILKIAWIKKYFRYINFLTYPIKFYNRIKADKINLVLHQNNSLDLLNIFRTTFTISEIKKLINKDIKYNVITRNSKTEFKNDIVNDFLLSDYKNYLSEELLPKVDRASMFNSLEVRVPFLDKELIQYVFQLNSRYKINNNKSKVILKKILEKYLPEELFSQKKRGFGAPLDNWLKNDLKNLINEYLEKDVIIKQGIFDVAEVEKVKSYFLNGKSKHYRIWNLISFQMWYFEYFKNNG